MDNKSKLSKDMEEKIHAFASDFYIQVEDKLTQLICSAIEVETSDKDADKSKDDYLALMVRYKNSQDALTEQEKRFTSQGSLLEQKVNALEKALAEKQNDLEASKQNAEVKLSQNTIDFTETIENLEKKLVDFQQKNVHQQDKQQEIASQLEEKLLVTEQALTVSKQEVDGLNARITVLTEQSQQDENQQLAVKLQQSQEKITQLEQELTVEKQKYAEENKVISAKEQEIQQSQLTAQQMIIALEQDKDRLLKLVATEQRGVKGYQQEITTLKDQVNVAQEGQKHILQRFNSNREKQELDNEKVRETIKFLRDENHELLGSHAAQNAKFTEQIMELEHKLTEYRLKFEYAQKQLTN
jgi:hypothetical protein